MIFVTVGTENFPFDRLMRTFDDAISSGKITGEVFAQIGNRTREPVNFPFARFIEYDQMLRRIQEADIVVTHAGFTVMLSLRLGKIPIVVPPMVPMATETIPT